MIRDGNDKEVINMRTGKFILLFIFVFISSPAVLAVSRFEKLLLSHPGTGVLLILLAGVMVAGLLIGAIHLGGVLNSMKSGRKRVSKEKTEEETREKKRQIPVGMIENVVLPQVVLESGEENYSLSSVREFRIGRSSSNDLIPGTHIASKYHAKIRPQEKGYVLYDLMSSNGTYVNGERIEKHVLKDGDNIAIGDLVFMFKTRRGREEKRKFHRLDVSSCNVRYFTYPSSEKSRQHSFIKNISVGGFCLVLNANVARESYLEFNMKLPDGKSVEGAGSVAWTAKEIDNGYIAGIKFTHVSERDLLDIYAYVSLKTKSSKQ